ncbi:hypothetical protein HC776_03700 [bacterium]|nr:hypothetical protein [bacterium]
MQNQLFRRSALERLSSPEQLDSLMQVTTPRAWIAVLGLLVILVVFGVWGFTGSIQIVTSGRGLLLKGGQGNDTINAPASGLLNDLYVDVNDIVGAGEIIARIENDAGEIVPVRTLTGGRILETLVSSNEKIEDGQTMVIIEPTGEDVELEAIFYLPTSEGKKVRPGMSVQVQPDTVSVEESGVMRGWVTSVGEFRRAVRA